MNLTIADSIAIKTLNKNALISGVGNELHLHTRDPKTTNRILSITLQGKIHGIEVGTENNEDRLLVYGEKDFLLLQWKQEYDFKLLHRGQLTDWISAGKFMRQANEFMLLTAHSVALRLEYCQDTKTCGIVERSSCSDKSTLYCAAIHGECWPELVCFGGNAFGELLIWQPLQKKATLLQRIASHNGVIFSINYNAEAHLLTTTSDDRSIRFWRVGQHSNEKWSETKLISFASGFGHVARVFQGRIIKADQQIYAITVGEDSYICVWRITGELIHKCRQQFGATIWNFEYVENTKTIYTVGSTGNILAFELQDIFQRDALKTTTTTILPAISRCQNNKSVEHYMAKIKFLSHNILVGITNKNNLVYTQNQTEEWQPISDFAAYKCTLLEVFKNLIAICGFKRLTLYKFTNAKTLVFEKYLDAENILNGIVRAFKFLTASKFLICDECGNCLLLHDVGEGHWKEHIIELPKCKEPWLTSAALIDMQYILISNRQGNVFLYKWCDQQRKFQHVDTLKHPHGNLGATLIKLVDFDSDATLFKSAGHDGSIKLLKLCNISSKLRIVKREIVPVAWVEFLEERHNDCDLLLGFNDNHFTVWSKLHDFILQLPCGGGHRCWDYCINDEYINLAFIQNKQVLLHKLKLFNNSSGCKQIQLPARNMWHVKPCNVLVCIEEPRLQAGIITISAGDDNLVKISNYECTQNASTKKLTQLNEIHAHISNVRALKVVKYGADADYLIFSGGGRAQLCITKFNLKTLQVEELLNFTVTAQSNSSVGIDNSESFSFDPETRIMALDVLSSSSRSPDSTEFYEIFVGCSDGFVRKYQLNTDWQLKPLAEVHYGRCILQIRLIDSLFLLVAATDGLIKFSNLQLNHVHLNLIHHASGINALDIRFNDVKRELQLLTGGDDQDVAYSRLSLAADKAAPLVLETQRFSGIHTAQVTAAQLSACCKYAFSSGVDQQILKINLQTQKVEVKKSTCVADIKGLQMCASDEMCFIYGCGLQVTSMTC